MSLKGLLQELRVEYLESFPAKIILIETLWADRDMEAIETEFHKMKGTGRTYGVPEATLIGEAIESICHCPPDECQPIIRHAIKILEQIYQAHQSGLPFDIADNKDFKDLVQRVQTLTGN